jgi:hypothetical protein
LKQQIELLKTELDETKELVITLQNITMDNSQKISTFAFTNDDQLFSTEIVEDDVLVEDSELIQEHTLLEDIVSENVIDTNAVSLKDFVAQELNA